MRRFFNFKTIGAGMLGLLAIGPSMQKQLQARANTTETTIAKSGERKATPVQAPASNQIVNEIGGMPFVSYRPDYGMSPRDYGMNLGRKGSAKKSNRLRYSHNAKVKRRMA